MSGAEPRGQPRRRLAGLLPLLPEAAVRERAVFSRALDLASFPGSKFS